MSSDDEFPDEFHGVNWDAIDIPALRETLISPHRPVSRPASASSHFLCDDDEIDAAFLAEVDALEERAAQAEGLFRFFEHPTAEVVNISAATSRPDRSSSRLRSDISG
jgi:hypothetical protein